MTKYVATMRKHCFNNMYCYYEKICSLMRIKCNFNNIASHYYEKI